METNSHTSTLPSRDAQTIFIGGIKPHLTKAHLNKHFKKHGDIVSIFLKTDPQTNLNKGFAFLVFKEVSSVEKVLSQPQIISGREVECRLSLQHGNNSFVKKEVSKSRLFVRCLNPDQTSAD
jgi:heterogeneous nuclear ribonucleoprotein A/B/D